MMTTNQYTTSSIADEPMTEGEQEHPLAQAGKDVGDSASHLAERAANVGLDRADQGKQQVAKGLDQLAGTIRRVSTDMEIEQPTIANAAMTAADQTERIAQYLRDTDARQILGTVEDVARRQPILFLGGAFLLGLAASRFIKAAGGGQNSSNDSQWGRSSYGYGQGASGYGTGYRSGATESYRATGTTGINGTLTDEGL